MSYIAWQGLLRAPTALFTVKRQSIWQESGTRRKRLLSSTVTRYLKMLPSEWKNPTPEVPYSIIIDRWDAPLFVIPHELNTPIKDITQAVIFDEKKSKDPVSTKADILKSGNFLHDLDKTLQKIIERVIERQNEQVLLNGGLDRMFFKVKFAEVPNKELTLKRAVPVGQLKQFKTDFVHMNKHNPLTNIEQAAGAFVDYMQSYESDY